MSDRSSVCCIQGRHRTSGENEVATLVVCVRTRKDIARIGGRPFLRVIAGQLGRAPSTISREVGRNNGRTKYRAANADERAWRSTCRPKLCRRYQLILADGVPEKLNDNWSPQQIAGWLKVE